MVDRFERFSLAISEISRYLHKIQAEEMEPYGLKGPHAVYLLTLYRNKEGLTAPRLCEICSKDKADVSRMLSIMEEKGLVLKESTSHTRYRGVFKLTEEGIQAAEHVSERARLAVSVAGASLNDETRELFYTSLETIAEKLRCISKQGLPDAPVQSHYAGSGTSR